MGERLGVFVGLGIIEGGSEGAAEVYPHSDDDTSDSFGKWIKEF